MGQMVGPVVMDRKVEAGQLHILLIKVILLPVRLEAELLRQVEDKQKEEDARKLKEEQDEEARKETKNREAKKAIEEAAKAKEAAEKLAAEKNQR